MFDNLKLDYLLLEVEGSKERTEIISRTTFQDLLNSNCKEYLNLRKYLGDQESYKIFRGVDSDKYSEDSGNDYFYGDTTNKSPRVSIGLNYNLHSRLFDNFLYSWRGFPKRSQSLICEMGNSRVAFDYGDCFEVIPFDDTKLGVCNSYDIWYSFDNTIPILIDKNLMAIDEACFANLSNILGNIIAVLFYNLLINRTDKKCNLDSVLSISDLDKKTFYDNFRLLLHPNSDKYELERCFHWIDDTLNILFNEYSVIDARNILFFSSNITKETKQNDPNIITFDFIFEKLKSIYHSSPKSKNRFLTEFCDDIFNTKKNNIKTYEYNFLNVHNFVLNDLDKIKGDVRGAETWFSGKFLMVRY